MLFGHVAASLRNAVWHCLLSCRWLVGGADRAHITTHTDAVSGIQHKFMRCLGSHYELWVANDTSPDSVEMQTNQACVCLGNMWCSSWKLLSCFLMLMHAVDTWHVSVAFYHQATVRYLSPISFWLDRTCGEKAPHCRCKPRYLFVLSRCRLDNNNLSFYRGLW